jgi:hypothetical protein
MRRVDGSTLNASTTATPAAVHAVIRTGRIAAPVIGIRFSSRHTPHARVDGKPVHPTRDAVRPAAQGFTTRAFAAITSPDKESTPSATAMLLCAAIEPISGGAISRPA